jgi:AGZA family xanthine/uracil permease-like MFS transporter
LVQAIPASLKRGIAVGIGLLITLVGLEWSGFVAPNPATLVTLGDLHHPTVWMSAAGMIVTCALLARRSRGAILAGIVTSALLGLAFGIVEFDAASATANVKLQTTTFSRIAHFPNGPVCCKKQSGQLRFVDDLCDKH